MTGYFAALERGDAPGALAFGDLPPGPHTLLTGTVLRAQQRIAPIHHVQVLSVRRGNGGTAVVTVHYEIDYPAGPQPVTDQVGVHRRGSSWYLDKTAVPTTIELSHALHAGQHRRRGYPGRADPAVPRRRAGQLRHPVPAAGLGIGHLRQRAAHPGLGGRQRCRARGGDLRAAQAARLVCAQRRRRGLPAALGPLRARQPARPVGRWPGRPGVADRRPGLRRADRRQRRHPVSRQLPPAELRQPRRDPAWHDRAAARRRSPTR